MRSYSFGMVLAAADGLGSKPLSDIGSQAACEAVCEAARLWSRNPEAPLELLIRLIHGMWELRIAPHPRSDCGTTCLFVILYHSGRMICGQLGDGLLAYRLGGEDFRLLHEKEDSFGNLTQSMHAVKGVHEWTCIDESTDGDISLLIATDGVSEDLVPETRGAFLDRLQELIAPLTSQSRRNAAIRGILSNWSVPFSFDDKTMIVFHRGVKDDAIHEHDE